MTAASGAMQRQLAAPRPRARTASASVVRGFDPKRAGLRFPNRFPDAVYLGIIRSPGLCGGMSDLVLDCYYAGVAPPATTVTPAVTEPLGAYLMRRQWDSTVGVNGSRLIVWVAEPLDFILRNWSLDEWDILRARVDAQRPVPLALIAANTWNPANSHQVVAYGYRVERDGAKVVLVWDPNVGAAELRLEPGQPTWTEPGTRSTWRGLFVERYEPVMPPGGVLA
jgi:hypothetical protein